MSHKIQSNSLLTKFFLYSALIGSMLVFGYLYWDVQGLEDEIMAEQIQHYEAVVQKELNDFFNPLEQKLSYQNHLFLTDNDSLFEAKSINKLILFLKYSPQISSLMVANLKGEELMVLESNGDFFLRKTRLVQGKLDRSFYQAFTADNLHWELNPKVDPNQEFYDVSQRDWFINALTDTTNHFSWTAPYLFFTTQEAGITASKLLHKGKDTLIVGYDVKLKDLSDFTAQLKIKKHSRVFMLTQDTLLLALPYMDKMEMTGSAYILQKADQLPSSTYQEFVDNWRADSAVANNFWHKGEQWKYSINTFHLGKQRFYTVNLLNRRDFSHTLKRFRYTLVGSIILLSIFMTSLIRAYRRNRKTNEILRQQKSKIENYSLAIEEQKQLVEHAYQETIDSITYAKRIQMACLPKYSDFSSIFPRGFIWFQPKDIVSGDFYWFGENKQKKWIIAADCTGHGVPGALLSILGTVYINALIVNFGITSPAKLFNRLRTLIIESLKEQEENAPHDGMDIAALCFEKDFSAVAFSGAKNPLYLLRKGEVRIYKGDRMAIGFESDAIDQGFQEQVIQLQKGDELFIFSDGLADQFGGEKGKKFMYKKIRDLLMEWQELKMPEKKQHFVEAFKAWKGEEAQVDDIILIGIAI